MNVPICSVANIYIVALCLYSYNGCATKVLLLSVQLSTKTLSNSK